MQYVSSTANTGTLSNGDTLTFLGGSAEKLTLYSNAQQDRAAWRSLFTTIPSTRNTKD